MAFDCERFVERFNTVWNGHDVDGILEMMTDDVIFEASFGKDPWGSRIVGTAAVRDFLGDMFELGDRSAAFHAQVKARAKDLPLDEVIFVGEQFGGLARDAARDALAASVRPGDAVLLKASHSMHLDELLP